MKRSLNHCLRLLLIVTVLAASGLHAEELEMINRAVNTSGLTGLLITTSPFTLPPRTVEVGLAALSENSLVPKYTATSYPLTVSLGLSRNRELALKVPYNYRNDDPGVKSRGMGDAELAFKWNVLPQPEYRSRPGIAVIASGIFPTGDRDAGMNTVSHGGGRLGVSLGSEIIWEDRIIGLYADGQGVVQDPSDAKLRDSYTLANAGILLPISKYRNLQMLVEFNQRSGKDESSVDGGDYSAVTYGLRLVSERFNLSFGTQFIHKSTEGYNNSSRVIGMLSLKI